MRDLNISPYKSLLLAFFVMLFAVLLPTKQTTRGTKIPLMKSPSTKRGLSYKTLLIVLFFLLFAVFVIAQVTDISFVSPTPSDGSTIDDTSVVINASITVPDLSSFNWNWNGTNYSFYDSDLVLMMNFDNNTAIGENATLAIDVSPYGNNGTFYNKTSIDTDVPQWTGGVYDGGLKFDGIKSNVIIPDSPSLRLDYAMTLEVWVKMDSWPTFTGNNQQYIITKGSEAAGQYYIDVETASHYPVFLIRNATTYYKVQGNAIQTDLWYHIVGTWNGTTMRFYVNGAQVGSETLLDSFSTSTSNLQLGWLGVANYEYTMNGTLDGIRIYNRSMELSEVQQHYNSELYKYDTNAWAFYTNQSGLSYGTYTYFGSAQDSALIENMSTIQTLNLQDLINVTAYFNQDVGTVKSDFYGVADNQALMQKGTLIDTNADGVVDSLSDYDFYRNKTVQAGIKLIRVSMHADWRLSTNTENLTEFVKWAYDNNIKLILIADAPVNPDTSINCSSVTWTCPPVNFTSFGDDIVTIVDNVTSGGIYNSTVIIEVKNEPDLNLFWLSDLSNDIGNASIRSDYYNMLFNATYFAFANYDPNIPVGGPALSNNDPTIGSMVIFNQFLGNFSTNLTSYHRYRQLTNPYFDIQLQSDYDWIFANCTASGNGCSNIYISEFNEGNAENKVNNTAFFGMQISLAYAGTLNSYPSNISLEYHHIGELVNYTEGGVNYSSYPQKYSMISEPQLDGGNNPDGEVYVSYNITKNFGNCMPSGAMVQNSTSDDGNIVVVIGNNSGSYCVVVINKDQANSKNVTIDLVSNDIENMSNYETGTLYTINSGTLELGVLNAYEVVFLNYTQEQGNTPPSFQPISDFSLDEDFSPLSIDLSLNVSDLEDATNLLTYNWTLNDSIFSLSIDNSTGIATFTSLSNAFGSVLVDISVVDTGGLSNSTEFTVTVNDLPESLPIDFVPPTPDDGTTLDDTSVAINVSFSFLSNNALANFTWNWNGTNYSFYDPDLLLMYNFDNVSSLGENDTYVVDLNSTNNATVYNGSDVCGQSDDCPLLVSGVYGSAYSFDGVNDYISPRTYIVNEGTNYTISLWFKAEPSANGKVITKYNNAASRMSITVNGSSYVSAGTYNGSSYVGASGGYDGSNGWHNIIYVHPANRESPMSLYFDGVLVTGTNAPATTTGNFLSIGADNGGTNPFNGSIDEVRVYNKLLTSDELQQQYLSNLQKYDVSSWAFYSNQSNLLSGNYTYFSAAQDSLGVENSTEIRNLEMLNQPPWWLPISNGTISIDEDSADNNISVGYQDYFMDLESNQTPTLVDVGTNETDTVCSLILGDIVCSALNNWVGTFIISVIGQDTQGLNATASFEVNVNDLVQPGGINLSVVPDCASDSSIVLCYHFDNNASLGENFTTLVDSSSYGWNATASGAPNFDGDANGGYYSFDGVNDRFDVINFDGVSGSQTITFSAWINPRDIQPASSRIMRTAGDNLGMGYSLGTGYWVEIKEQDGSALSTDNYGWRVNKSNDEWDWIVGRYDMENGHTDIFVNGILSSTTDHGNNQSIIGADTLYIGWEGLSTRYFNGSIDELIVYNRTLSTGDIKKIYDDYIGDNISVSYALSQTDSIIYNKVLDLNISIDDTNIKSVSIIMNNNSYNIFDDLLLMYNFDNRSELGESDSQISDLSGNGFDRVLSGPTYESISNHNSLGFNATGSASYSYDHYNNYDYNGSFTASVWVLFRKDVSGCNGIILSEASGDWNLRTCSLPQFNLYNATTGARTYVGFGSNQAPRTASYSGGQPNNDNLDTWHFMTIRYDAVNNYSRFDMDMNIYGDSNISGGLDETWSLGNGIGSLFNGTLDDMMIFNRYLSDEEIYLLSKSKITRFNDSSLNVDIDYSDFVFVGNNSLSIEATDYSGNTNTTETINFYYDQNISLLNPIIVDGSYFIDNFEDYNTVNDVSYNWLGGQGVDDEVINESYDAENLSWTGAVIIVKPFANIGSYTTSLGNINTQSIAINEAYNTTNGFGNFTYFIRNDDLWLEAANYQTSWIAYRMDWKGGVDTSSNYYVHVRNNYSGGADANTLGLRHREYGLSGVPNETDVLTLINGTTYFMNNERIKNWNITIVNYNSTVYINDEFAFTLEDTFLPNGGTIQPKGTFGIRWAGTGVIGKIDDVFIYETPQLISPSTINLSVGFVFDSYNYNAKPVNMSIEWSQNGINRLNQATDNPSGSANNWNNTIIYDNSWVNYTLDLVNNYDVWDANLTVCANATDYERCSDYEIPSQKQYRRIHIADNGLLNNTLGIDAEVEILDLNNALIYAENLSVPSDFTDINSNDGKNNLSLGSVGGLQAFFVLDNFSIVEGVDREFSPVFVNVSSSSSSSKHIDSELSVTVFNVSGTFVFVCGSLLDRRLVYSSHSVLCSRTWDLGLYECGNDLVTLVLPCVEPGIGSNVLRSELVSLAEENRGGGGMVLSGNKTLDNLTELGEITNKTCLEGMKWDSELGCVADSSLTEKMIKKSLDFVEKYKLYFLIVGVIILGASFDFRKKKFRPFWILGVTISVFAFRKELWTYFLEFTEKYSPIMITVIGLILIAVMLAFVLLKKKRRQM